MIDKNFIDWFKPNVSELYASHKNNDLPTFSIKTGHHKTRRIDFIFRTFKGRWGCIEFEHGDRYGELTTGATQLQDFYLLVNNGSKILINEIEIKPDLYLLATKYSKLGYLYKNDRRIIQYGGYDELDTLRKENNSIFHARRWMWRFCGRNPELMDCSNPIGCNQFSVIGKSYDGVPEIELYGNTLLKIKEM